MRTIIVLPPQSTSLSPVMMFLRACSLSSGATASSQSRKMMSALDCAAFLNSAGLVPGTASSERCNLAVACSMVVKLIPTPRSGGGAMCGFSAQHLGDRAAQFARARRHGQSVAAHGLGLLRGAVAGGGDDRPGMAHAPSLRRGQPGHVADDRLSHVLHHPLGRLCLLRAADLTDHDDGFGLRILLEQHQVIEE